MTPFLRVDDEEDEIRFVDRAPSLLRYAFGDRRGIDDVDAAGINEDEALAVPLADDLLAVSRHARGLVHDGLTAGGKTVHER